jgi:Na+-transporting methylmalonyl-CoA/oxaloacetate decarboxylase gamma subunit
MVIFLYKRSFDLIEQGLNISILGILIVFMGLSLIAFLIRFVDYLGTRRKKQKIGKDKQIDAKELSVPSEVSVAIGMALYLNRLFSEEEHEITIKKVRLPFSPWVTRGRNAVVTASNIIFSKKWGK